MKVCRVCKTQFAPMQPMARVCSPFCALTFARSVRAKAEKVAQVKDRRETKQKLDKLKSRSQWAREAQASFNAFIRARDADQPCISCGRHHGGQYHAGHYLSVGARPELRFVESNVHKQCQPCNTHLSGNAVLYRQALQDKLGAEVLAYLEGPHKPKKYTVDELTAIKAHYAAETKKLKEAQA